MAHQGTRLPYLIFGADMPTADSHVLICGRWDNCIAVVDLAVALDPVHRGTDRAVISRPRVTPDVLAADGTGVPACGLPVSIAVTQDRRWAFVVNHAGNTAPDAAALIPHGHAGAIAVLDLKAVLDPSHDGTTGALRHLVPTGTGGPVGCALTADDHYLLVSSAEGQGTEDGGHQITTFDVAKAAVVAQTNLECGATALNRHPSPHPDFGSFPNPNGIAISPAHGGLVFTANGGTDNVSVLSLKGAVAGSADAEISRVAVGSGPFGLAVSPDGQLVAVANRESARTGCEGNTVSLIDVQRALYLPDRAVVARVLVGTDQEDVPTRPMTLAFSPDGHFVFVACFRSGTVSRIDVALALAGDRGEQARTQLKAPNGAPPGPRGVHVTSDGRCVLVAGGARGTSASSILWVLDAESLTEIGLVTGVGNESYLLTSFGLRQPWRTRTI